MHNINRFLPILVVLFFFSWDHAAAQYLNYFGRNKVQYTNFDWQVMQTEHVDLYYFPEEKDLAEIAAASAERSYRALESQFSLTIHRRIPLILYSTHHYFRETNTVPVLLPESVGAFTEFLKGRVVMPNIGSYHEFDQVLRHELIHVFTLEKIKSVLKNHRKELRVGPPLWFSEGLAEHWSEGWASEADMFIRDAIISGYLVDIPNINRIFGSFLMYKEGQSFLKHLEEAYGDDVIELIFANWWRGRTFEEIFALSVGKSLEQVSDEWVYGLRKKYYPMLEKTDMPSKIATQLTKRGINIKPVSVPGASDSDIDDGMVFMSTRNGYEDICWAPLDGTEDHVELLVRGGRSAQFESFHFLRTQMAVNGNRQLAFVSESQSRDVIYVWDLKERRQEQRLTFEGLIGLSSPSWSPDGERIVFSGQNQAGMSDLYIIDRITGVLTKLTNDIYEDREPDWSPDGTKIVFSSDRADGGDLHGWHNLYTIDPVTRALDVLTVGAHNDLAPAWSPDGNWLAFTSDRDWGMDIYLMDRERQVHRLTRVATGVMDPNWTSDGESLLFTGFEGFQFQICRLDIPDSLDQTRTLPTPKRLVKWSPERIKEQEGQPAVPYKKRYSLDLAQGGLIAAPTTSDIAVGGGALFSLSDMLGNHSYNIMVSNSTQTTEDFLKSFNFFISRMNLSRRINYGYGVFHLNGNFGDATSFLFDERRLGSIFLYSYPFSKFSRLDGNIGYIYSDKNRLFATTDPERQSHLVTNYLAYVHDTIMWGPTGPVDGEGFQFGVTHLTDLGRGESFATTFLADYRRYFRFARQLTYASRVLGIGSWGEEPQIIRLGGSWDFRGYRFRSLQGNRMFLVNQEVRFPVLNFLAVGFPFGAMSFSRIQGALFVDVGNVWYDDNFQDVIGSFGGGVRVNLGGPLVLRFDFSKRVSNNFTALEDGIKFTFWFGPDF